MAINTQSFSQLLRQMATVVQGRAAQAVDMTVGAVLRALLEAVAAQLLWLQAQILSLLAATRASTSTGSDLDSWMADYGLTRLPASCATGYVTLARYSAAAPAYVAATGVLAAGQVSGTAAVQVQGTNLQYVILPDTTSSYFNASANQYVIPGGTASIPVLVGCLTPGSAGNAAAGAINTLVASLPGVDTVANGSALGNAADVETDAALRLRFVNYLASLSQATKEAVTTAVLNVGREVSCVIVENRDYVGNGPHPGYFYVVADDGSGSPPSSFLTAVGNAVDAVRPLAVSFEVFGPTLVTVAVSLSVSLAADYDAPTEQAAIAAAITAYINALPLGAGLPWTRLAQLAYDGSPATLNVGAVQLNGVVADIPAAPQQVIRAGSVTVVLS